MVVARWNQEGQGATSQGKASTPSTAATKSPSSARLSRVSK